MNTLFSRWLPALTLATWSGILLWFSISGRMKDMLAPQFRIYAVIAGVLLAAMALIIVLARADTGCCSAAECGHSLSRFKAGRIVAFLVLLLPLSATALVEQRGFSASFVAKKGMVEDASVLGLKPKPSRPADFPLPTNNPDQPLQPSPEALSPGPGVASTPPAPAEPPKDVTDYLSRTPDGLIIAEVLDLLYAAQDNVLRKDFEGKAVQLIGQFMPDKTSAKQDARFKAVRMFMTCCAADARPVATLVEFSGKAPELPEMTWVKISGKPAFPVENGRRIAVLMAEKIEKTEPPEEAMVY